MKKKRRIEDHPDVARLFEAARRNVDSAPRKHHLVPRMHLDNWAVDDKLRVVDLDAGSSWLSNPAKAARRTDYYRLEHDDLPPEDVPPLLFETILGKVEADAVPGLARLREDAPTGDLVQTKYHPDLIMPVVDFLAFQAVRGERHRTTVYKIYAQSYQTLYADLVDRDKLAAELARRFGRAPTEAELEENHTFMQDLADGTVTIGPAEAAATVEVGKMAEAIRDLILERNWRVYRCSRPLVCPDEPVVPVGGPGTRRTEVPGFLNAGVVLFPLDPMTLLAMFRMDIEVLETAVMQTLDPSEVREVNRELSANTQHYVFERPGDHIAETFTLPRWPSVMDFEGGYRTVDDPEPNVTRQFKRTRWANSATQPPWPIERWWTAAPIAPGAEFPRKDNWSLSNLEPRRR
ncbi:MAG TPA: DUF4238 domain-containing protein [Acidimicrobiales bacterium]|nr:DUF4238 domain-containing protein [Acidimicrobiales bacterium]